MSLYSFIDNQYTDKNTTHSYLDIYENLFNKKKETAKNILEIGISTGGSIKLWHDYFTKAIIYGIEKDDTRYIKKDIFNNNRIKLLLETDAYNSSVPQSLNTKFDIIIDDGPHTLESQIDFIKLYSDFLEDDGILIIEDIAEISYLNTLKDVTPEHLKQYIKTIDMRDIKGRFDDILFIIDKSNKN